MAEETRAELLPIRKEPFSGSAENVYRQILGLREFPKSPKDMPENVLLPAPAIGDLERSIFYTGEVGKEREQIIDWDSKRQQFIGGSVLMGREGTTGILGIMGTSLREFTGHQTLAYYHTHNDSDWRFSSMDVALRKGTFVSDGYMYLVGSLAGVGGLFQTEKSPKKIVSSLHFLFDFLPVN